MRAFVRFELPDGKLVELGHGDLIGRLVSAPLSLDDPRVSEAHALVTVRRGEFVLLSLRRMFAVRGKAVTEAVLRPGMAIELAEGLALVVRDVVRPTHVLAIEVPTLGRRTLPGLASVHLGDEAHLSMRFDADAALHVWWNGDGWRARARGGATLDVAGGSEITIAGTPIRFVEVEIDGSVTTAGAGAVEAPLRLVAWYDGVEIHRDGRPPLTFGGVGARILSELVTLEGPAEWHVIAKEVWREPVEMPELRHRWDVNLARIRARLREAGVRGDLLRSTGAGYVQLVKYPADVFEDRT